MGSPSPVRGGLCGKCHWLSPHRTYMPQGCRRRCATLSRSAVLLFSVHATGAHTARAERSFSSCIAEFILRPWPSFLRHIVFVFLRGPGARQGLLLPKEIDEKVAKLHFPPEGRALSPDS